MHLMIVILLTLLVALAVVATNLQNIIAGLKFELEAYMTIVAKLLSDLREKREEIRRLRSQIIDLQIEIASLRSTRRQ
jgi:uncharacterized protein YlxW (UPF0749 family)